MFKPFPWLLAVALALTLGCSAFTSASTPTHVPSPTVAPEPSPTPEAATTPEPTQTPETTSSTSALDPGELRPTEDLEVRQIVLAVSPAGLPAAAIAVAVQGGLFESVGLQLTPTAVRTPEQAREFLQQGIVQVAMLPLVEVARTIGSPRPLVAIGAVSGSNPYNVVITEEVAQAKGLRVSSRLRERLAMLNGLRIGVSANTLAQGTMGAVLDAAGLESPQDVEVVVLSAAEQVEALGNGDVDGILAIHPYLESVLVEGNSEILINLSRGEVATLDPFPWLVLATTKEFSLLAPQTLIAVVRGLWGAESNIRRDPTRSQEVLEMALGESLPSATFEEGVRVYFPSVAGNPLITPRAYNTVIRLSQGPQVPYLQVVDNQFTSALIRQ